jgi:lipid-A-disaccharide synthase
MKYFLIAGEKSGDLHGSNLIKSLQQKDVNAQFQFWGGDLMQSAAGANGKLIVHYRQLAVMGFWEVIANIFRIRRLLKECRQDVIAYRPEVLILIDFGGFNMRIARYANKANIKVFYYISPKIWAWNTSRARIIKKYVDRMFVILPFEKKFYKQFDMEVDYVGNPVVDSVTEFTINETTLVPNHAGHKPIIAILPGSRIQEIQHVKAVLKKLIAAFPEYQFMVAKVESVPQDLYSEFENVENVELVSEKPYHILSMAHAAIVTSGTATLETALLNVPQVVVYKANLISYLIGKAVIKVRFISLVNLIADKEIVKELIQRDLSASNLQEILPQLVNKGEKRTLILNGYSYVRQLLGSENASDKAANLMVEYLR